MNSSAIDSWLQEEHEAHQREERAKAENTKAKEREAEERHNVVNRGAW